MIKNLSSMSPVYRLQRCASSAWVAVALSIAASSASYATQTAPIRIAVFDFELNDKSAGGGIIEQDALDQENLKNASQEARRLLEQSGRYALIDTSGASDQLRSLGGIQNCNQCNVDIAKELDADQSMVGVIGRINRTEYTLQIVIRDTASGEVVASEFTGLRMGANYAWPRGVKWLMTNRILSAEPKR